MREILPLCETSRNLLETRAKDSQQSLSLLRWLTPRFPSLWHHNCLSVQYWSRLRYSQLLQLNRLRPALNPCDLDPHWLPSPQLQGAGEVENKRPYWSYIQQL